MMTLEQKRESSRKSMEKLRQNPEFRERERARQKAYYLRLKEAYYAQQALEKLRLAGEMKKPTSLNRIT